MGNNPTIPKKAEPEPIVFVRRPARPSDTGPDFSKLRNFGENAIRRFWNTDLSRRGCQIGVGSTAIIPKHVPQIQPPPYDKTIEAKAASTFWEWNKVRQQTFLHPEELEKLKSRISYNASSKYEQQREQAEQARLNRERESYKLKTQSKTPQAPPTLPSLLHHHIIIDGYKKNDLKYFPPKPARPELTPPMLELIHSASKPNPINEILVELDGVQILRKDIQTLLGLNWLNDEIINFYMSLIVQRGQKSGYKKVYAFNTFFYPKLKETGYNSIKRWTRKVDIFSYYFLLVPVHLGNHWCLASVDFHSKTISYYDSLGGHTNGCCDILLDYLRYESNDKKKQDFDDENWRLIDRYSEGIPQQKNCSDCGVFACIYAEYLTRQAKMTFGQEHMPYFRKKMIYEIIQKTILE